MRSVLRDELERLSGDSWKHVTDQIGMFCFTGMTADHVAALQVRNNFKFEVLVPPSSSLLSFPLCRFPFSAADVT